MSDEVIEPSEIIIGKDGTIKEKTKNVDPQIRFLARTLDYTLFIFTTAALSYLLRGRLFVPHSDSLIPIQFIAWIPFEALLLSTWGTTIGKWFLRTKLVLRKREKLDYMSALRRGFNVWFRGLGMGIPIVNVICLLTAYQKLKLFKTTSWDSDEHTSIVHHPVGQWRIITAAFFSILGFFFYYTYS